MPLSLMMDILIVVLLAATIFYAVKLSRHLDVFRSNRADMERLIRDLSTQITRAQEGITTLDDAARSANGDLRKMVDRATGLSDELQIIIDSGDRLAERLEALATKNREISDEMSQTSVNLVYPGGKAPVLSASRHMDVPARDTSSSLFAIRDPDFDAGDDAENDDTEYGSESERQLAAALRRKGNGDKR